MVTTVRKSIFETNSSSTHSITINVGNEWDNIIPDEDGKIYLNGGEFGWEWEKYNDALTKANYCAIAYFHHEKKSDLLKEVIKEYTGANEVEFNFTTDWSKNKNYSYIDHGGIGECSPAFESKETLKNFIFNKSSLLFTGNDNSSAPNKFYDDPNEKYTHQLRVILTPEFILTWDLQKEPNDEIIEDALTDLLEDVRFNKTRSKWEVSAHYWTGGEAYYEFDDWKRKSIDLINQSIYFFNGDDKITVKFEIIKLD